MFANSKSHEEETRTTNLRSLGKRNQNKAGKEQQHFHGYLSERSFSTSGFCSKLPKQLQNAELESVSHRDVVEEQAPTSIDIQEGVES